MESKVQKLRRWLCRLICGEKKYTPVVHIEGPGFEAFDYEGYNVELRYDGTSLSTRVTLMGTCVLSGNSMYDNEWVWVYDAPHVPSYKVRAFIRDYSEKRLQLLRNK